MYENSQFLRSSGEYAELAVLSKYGVHTILLCTQCFKLVETDRFHSSFKAGKSRRGWYRIVLLPPFFRLSFGSLDAQSVDSQPSCGACLCRAEFLFELKSELSAAGHEASTCAWLHTVMALLQQKRWSECRAQYKWR